MAYDQRFGTVKANQPDPGFLAVTAGHQPRTTRYLCGTISTGIPLCRNTCSATDPMKKWASAPCG